MKDERERNVVVWWNRGVRTASRGATNCAVNRMSVAYVPAGDRLCSCYTIVLVYPSLDDKNLEYFTRIEQIMPDRIELRIGMYNPLNNRKS